MIPYNSLPLQLSVTLETLGNPAFLSIISSRLFFELKSTGEQKHIPASLANISIPNSDHRMEDISGYMVRPLYSFSG